jgi:Bifunctional DNA primase/polymerase, N-terminal
MQSNPTCDHFAPRRVFADHALGLREAGFAVLPARGKEPIVKGFTKWRGAPSMHTVAGWADKFPDANPAYIAGLSGLVVVDGDTPEAAAACEELFGATPGLVLTRRGKHALYREPAEEMPSTPVDLRKLFGINADLKFGRGGQSIVMAPPSIHPKGGDYAWNGCDPSVLRNLPPFPLKKLLDRIERLSKKPSAPGEMRDGSRTPGCGDGTC